MSWEGVQTQPPKPQGDTKTRTATFLRENESQAEMMQKQMAPGLGLDISEVF